MGEFNEQGSSIEGDPDPAPPAGTLREDPAAQVRDLLVPARVARAPVAEWRELFDASDPRELLTRLAEGDPLGLRARGIRHVQRTALAIHADRLFIRLLALVAFKGLMYAGRPALDEWLEKLITAGARDLVRADLEAELAQRPLSASEEVGYRFMPELIGVEPALGRLAAVRFNLLDPATRKVLWSALFEGRSPQDLASADADERYRSGLAVLSELAPIRMSDFAGLREEDL